MTSDDDKNSKEDIKDDLVFEDEDDVLAEFSLSEKLKKLRQDLKSCNSEKTEYLAGWQRAKADYVNLKSQNENNIKELEYILRFKMVEDLFPVIDGFEMARKNESAWKSVDANWRQGIEFIHDQLKRVLNSWGVEQISVKINEEIDYNLHESLETILTSDQNQDHKIAEVLQNGYKLKEKVLRPAKVKIYLYKSN